MHQKKVTKNARIAFQDSESSSKRNHIQKTNDTRKTPLFKGPSTRIHIATCDHRFQLCLRFPEMPAVVYLYALTFILQFCFAMFFVPPRLKIVAKNRKHRKKHRPLNITGTFLILFYHFFHIALVLQNCVSFVVKLHSVCVKSRPFSPLTLLFVRFSARSYIT